MPVSRLINRRRECDRLFDFSGLWAQAWRVGQRKNVEVAKNLAGDEVHLMHCLRLASKAGFEQKTRISTGLYAGFLMSQDPLEHDIGGDRWT